MAKADLARAKGTLTVKYPLEVTHEMYASGRVTPFCLKLTLELSEAILEGCHLRLELEQL
jgi:hypothetical protein